MAHCWRQTTWSAVCSEATHSQFGEGARPHLCMDEWNPPTRVRRRLSLTQAARDKPISTGLEPVSGTKARSLEAFSQYSAFHLWFVHSEARMPRLAKLSKRFRAIGTKGRLDLSLTWRVSEDPLKRPYKIWSGSRDPRLSFSCTQLSFQYNWSVKLAHYCTYFYNTCVQFVVLFTITRECDSKHT